MAVSNQLQQLCETWWEQLADSTRSEHHRFAEQFLELLEWSDPAPLAIDALAPQLSTVSYALWAQGQTSIAAHFTLPGALEPAGSVIERNIDFCPTSRILCDATRAMKVRYCFVSDLFRSYLYDVHTEELLLHADSPTEFKAEMETPLQRCEVEHGALEEVRRQPRSAVARQLREWRRRWTDTLVGQTRRPEDDVELAIDRLIVMRYLLEHDVLKRPGWRFKQRYEDLMNTATAIESRGTGKAMLSLLHDLWFDWKGDIFKPIPDLEVALERDEITTPLLAEFALLSRSKFALPTVLESFNYGDATEKARVRMIPDEDEERLSALNRQTESSVDSLRIEIDVEDEGYRSVLHWFDRLTNLYRILERDFETNRERETPRVSDVDLFQWSENDSTRPAAFGQPYHYAIENGMTIFCASPRQRRTARLLLYLHVIARFEQYGLRFANFPDIEGALQPRPHFTGRDRKTIFNAENNDEWHAV